MTEVGDMKTCPTCGGEAENYLETKTNESEFNCRGACGYACHHEISTNESTGRSYWVETEYFPISKDGRVARPSGAHKWTREDF